jgi:5-methyltetrahydrofolate--homocysteine methyltransferase
LTNGRIVKKEMNMGLLYKSDWDQVKEEYKRFWKLENEKPLVAVRAPKDAPLKEIKSMPTPPEIARLGNHWYSWALNPEYAANQAEMRISKTFYGGVAFPYQLASFGPCMSAAFLGIEPIFRKDTTWFKPPIITDWSKIPDLKYDPNNKWWRVLKELVRKLGDSGGGKFLVGIGCDILSGLDTLIHLRGSDRLALDLFLHPEEVKDLTLKVSELEVKWFEELYQDTQRFQKGCVNWLGLWSEGRTYPVQCDFAQIISPRMFEEFALPFITKFCRYLDNSIYHLDGKGQIAHLDILLDLDELHGIQWSVPVLGVDPPHDSEFWYPYFRRIQSADKILYIWSRPESVKRLISDLSPQGLFIDVEVKTEREARELLKEIGYVAT